MKLSKTILIFLFMLMTCVCASAQNTAADEVRKLERAWLDAYEKNDAKAMNEIFAEDFTITFPDGSIQTKKLIMSSLSQPRGANSPSYKFYTEDVEARVYGDTVILIGRVVTEWQKDGKTMREQNRYTDTYVRSEERRVGKECRS